ncbi:SDR family oxidoreductase [Paracoccaceae bacterium]|nr:SDR family oxidoreductase [Paracoccaceae bacterium]
MDLGIQKKTALVMSSSRGLGEGIAKSLALEGVHVLLSGRNKDRLSEIVDEIEAAGGQADFVVADLVDPSSVNTIQLAARELLGQIDIFIANTGGPPPGIISGVDPNSLTKQFEMMVVRIVELSSKFIPDMKAAGWGRILAIGSSGVIQPIPNLGISNVVRSALVGWTKSLSNDLAGSGITVNMLLPGRIHTKRIDELDQTVADKTGQTLESVRQASKATIPVGRYGRVEEFADTATFICSDRAGYITGSLIRCDGGLIKSV